MEGKNDRGGGKRIEQLIIAKKSVCRGDLADNNGMGQLRQDRQADVDELARNTRR